MDNHELIQEALINARNEEDSEALRKAVLATDIQEIARMSEGDNEELEPMTPEQLDSFLNAEDETLKEDRGETPVGEQITPFVETTWAAQHAANHRDGTAQGAENGKSEG
jgi:hypothetical protein